MKGRQTKALIILVVAVLLGFFLYQYFSTERHLWYFIYKPDVKEPYGGYVLAELLKNSRDTTQFIVVKDTIFNQVDLQDVPAHSNYIFLGDHLYLDSSETRFLLDFVAAGNNAWVISTEFSPLLLDSLLTLDYGWDEEEYYEEEFYEEEYYEDEQLEEEYDDEGYYEFYYDDYLQVHVDSMILLNLWENEEELLEIPYECRYARENIDRPYGWTSFSEYVSSKAEEDLLYLGLINDELLNYLSVDYGEGTFYLHSTPEVFTNYFLLDTLAFEYSRKVFQDLGEGSVYWDEDNRSYQYEGGNYPTSSYAPDDGPLVFILSQPPLRYAWYTFLFSVLLYLIFGARRKQRIIPVLSKNENTSIEYSETIGQLYLTKKNHKKICLLKMDLFLAFLRERYKVNTAVGHPDDEDDLIKLVSVKSNVDSGLVRSIFNTCDTIKVETEVSEDLMLRFHRMLEHFYSTCK
jgi:hypothetical protein